MKDCSLSVAPIVKGERFSLDQCRRVIFERVSMKNIHEYSKCFERVSMKNMPKFVQDLTLHMQLEY